MHHWAVMYIKIIIHLNWIFCTDTQFTNEFDTSQSQYGNKEQARTSSCNHFKLQRLNKRLELKLRVQYRVNYLSILWIDTIIIISKEHKLVRKKIYNYVNLITDIAVILLELNKVHKHEKCTAVLKIMLLYFLQLSRSFVQPKAKNK